jgi:hypothetical protein
MFTEKKCHPDRGLSESEASRIGEVEGYVHREGSVIPTGGEAVVEGSASPYVDTLKTERGESLRRDSLFIQQSA